MFDNVHNNAFDVIVEQLCDEQNIAAAKSVILDKITEQFDEQILKQLESIPDPVNKLSDGCEQQENQNQNQTQHQQKSDDNNNDNNNNTQEHSNLDQQKLDNIDKPPQSNEPLFKSLVENKLEPIQMPQIMEGVYQFNNAITKTC